MRWFVPAVVGVVILASTAATRAEKSGQGSDKGLKLVEVRKIWDQGAHNAFTSLVRFQDRWYCSFREGADHMSFDGSARILVSDDGVSWTSAGLLSMPQFDVRDPKLSVSPDGRLIVNCGAAQQIGPTPKDRSTASLVWTSRDGQNWEGPVEPVEAGVWLWRVTWHEGTAYGLGYQRKPFGIHLYSSNDGVRYQKKVTDLQTEEFPNEASLVFQADGTAVCLLRRDAGQKTAMVGTAKPPYDQWQWKDLGQRLGGPALVQLPDGRFLAGARSKFGEDQSAALFWLDEKAGTLTEALTLASGGKDCSYPGFVWHDGLLWVSYYSSHEGKANIYLAKIKVTPMSEKADLNPPVAHASVAATQMTAPKGKVLFDGQFNGLDPWHLEGLTDGVTVPEPGVLRVNCTGSRQGNVGAMAFLKQDFPDDIAVEYDLVVEQKSGLLITFLAMQGRNGEDAITGVPKRDGIFKNYVGDNASTRSYHISVCRYNDKGVHTGVSNWRRNPGLNLMTSGKDLCTETNTSYRVVIIKRGPQCQIWVNGELGSHFIDPGTLPGPIPSGGKIGFRAIGSEAIFRLSNIKVTALQ